MTDEEKVTAGLYVTNQANGIGSNVCPAGCQTEVDTMYSDCEYEASDWEETKPTMKILAEAMGCGGAAQAAPLFAAIAAVAGHFFN